MATISVQVIDKDPLVLTYTSAGSSGDTLTNTFFDTIVNVKNDSGSNLTVLISALVPCDAGDYTDVSEVVATGTIGTFPIHSRLTNWSSKLVNVRYSAVTEVGIAAYRVLR